jgi:hypothetical protein
VAPVVPLARGWERQLDTANNPLFYDDDGLSSREYQQWLYDAGVKFVAVANVAPDYAAIAEERLITGGLDYLQPAWSNANWRVWKVVGGPGIVSGPASLTRVDAGGFTIDAQVGTIFVRLREALGWTVPPGAACVKRTAEGWTQLTVLRPGMIDGSRGLFQGRQPSAELGETQGTRPRTSSERRGSRTARHKAGGRST